MTTEQLDEQRARHIEAFVHLRVHLGVESHLFTSDYLQLLTNALGRNHKDRQHNERQQRETPFEGEHCTQSRHEHNNVAHNTSKC